MPFTIFLQRNLSDKNVVNKSVEDIRAVVGDLKNETSIIDPVILIEGNVASWGLANYMYIQRFGRSYYITDVKSVRNNLFEVHGHVDVLKTYAAGIKGCEAILRRQEREYNLYLNDGIFKAYQNPEIVIKNFPSGFSGWEYVLAVAGSAEASSNSRNRAAIEEKIADMEEKT